MMVSFSNKIKEEIIEIEPKIKKCCQFSLLYGFLFCTEQDENGYKIKTTNVKNAELFIKLSDILFKKQHLNYYKNGVISIDSGILRYFTVVEYENKVFKCPECRKHFLKSIFLLRGSVTDPEKSYLIELSMSDLSKGKELSSFLESLGIETKLRERQGKYVLYSKRSEAVEDFLAYIGAQGAAFEIMNSKILKDIKNQTNRVMNCDDANINKSIAASEKYLSAINYLIESNNLLRLPEQLQETALKRLEFKELNYTDLGNKFNPGISKSGLFHRLEKIYELSELYKKECKEEI